MRQGTSGAFADHNLKVFRALLPVVFVLAAGGLSAKPVAPAPAPAWALKDLEGNLVGSEAFKGKVVVVDFWATWCRPCRAEMPGYTELQKKYGGQGLVIVGVSVDNGGAAAVRKLLRKAPVGYLILLADDKVVDAFGGMDGIPTTFIIDRAGLIRDRKYGLEKTADFEKRLVPLLAPGPS